MTLACIGPFTGAPTGRLVATRETTAAFEAAGLVVDRFDVGRGVPPRPFRKPLRWAAAVLRLLLRPPRMAYIAVEARWGVLYNIPLAFVLRARGVRKIVLHHHGPWYIEQRDERFVRLFRATGTNALHVVQCEALGSALRRNYPEVKTVLALTNASWLPMPDDCASRTATEPVLTLGHLSNLSKDKGTPVVLEAFEAAKAAGLPVRLLLAGPAEPDVASLIDRCLERHAGDARYMGAVSGQGKAEFFGSLDVFLLPSRFETEGIVLLEALAAGVPVIASDRGCIRRNVGAAGVVVADHESFAARTIEYVSALVQSRDLAPRRVAARSRALELKAEGLSQMGALVSVLRAASTRDRAKSRTSVT